MDRSGEPVVLTGPDGTPLDRFAELELERNASIGRDPADPARLCLFAVPTPGGPNAPRCFRDADLGAPTLSRASGLVDEPFELVVEPPRPEDRVIYTLDGSYPDLERNAAATRTYAGPIRVEDRSDEPDVLAAVPTTFPADVVPWMDYEWRPPSQPVPKATVVRARIEHGAESVGVWFVGGDHRRPELPIVHLAIDHDHLFDPVTGIYHPGRRFDEHVGAGGSVATRLDTPANHDQRGRDWERPPLDELDRAVVLTVCEPDDGCTYERDIGVRVHGNWSRSLPAKSLRLYARNDYGDRRLEHPFFGEDGASGHRRLLLRNSGQDWGMTMLQDGYLQQLVSHLAIDTQAYRPAVLYLSGEYWGIFNLRERYDEHYLAVVHDVAPSDVVLVGQHLELDAGRPADLISYRALLDELADGSFRQPVAERLDAELDLDSLFDYLIVEIFVANNDWPQANVAMWRSRTRDAAAPADGRWRWLLADLDHAGRGFGRRGPGHGTALVKEVDDPSLDRVWYVPDDPTEHEGIPLLVSTILEDDGLRAAFLTRFAHHLDTTFDADRTVAELDALEATLADEMVRHVARWSYPASVEAWRGHVDELRRFMRERPDAQRAQLAERFGPDWDAAVARARTDAGR
jgi:hypothetical protein